MAALKDTVEDVAGWIAAGRSDNVVSGAGQVNGKRPRMGVFTCETAHVIQRVGVPVALTMLALHFCRCLALSLSLKLILRH